MCVTTPIRVKLLTTGLPSYHTANTGGNPPPFLTFFPSLPFPTRSHHSLPSLLPSPSRPLPLNEMLGVIRAPGWGPG